ncbi:hypothetical protein IWX63_003375 [Arthrobacter sp. CAN_A2]|uniref:hypothetical protein n=1 Tax=Arthrobacter sp. CAN_A2 TaxID=2787718 RepID=UPI0018EFE8B9
MQHALPVRISLGLLTRSGAEIGVHGFAADAVLAGQYRENAAASMRLIDPRDFAECWMILLQGSVVAALGTGYTSPGRIKKLGQLLIASHTPKSG